MAKARLKGFSEFIKSSIERVVECERYNGWGRKLGQCWCAVTCNNRDYAHSEFYKSYDEASNNRPVDGIVISCVFEEGTLYVELS